MASACRGKECSSARTGSRTPASSTTITNSRQPCFLRLLLRSVIERYHFGPRRTRIFNHSINAVAPCRLRHMSAWAAEIDLMSAQYDILFIQSAGNLYPSCDPPWIGVQEHLRAGRNYPDYLCEHACRVSNPAQSLQALTVGSVAYGAFDGGTGAASPPPAAIRRRSAAPASASGTSSSPMSSNMAAITLSLASAAGREHARPSARDCYPELVRSTLHPPGPAIDRDEVGTSYAAPKVTRIAARLQEVLPEESCLLYRWRWWSSQPAGRNGPKRRRPRRRRTSSAG